MKKWLCILLSVLLLTLIFSGCKGASPEKLHEAKDKKESVSEQASKEAPDTTVQPLTAEVGSYLTYGVYEQDNDTANGQESIEWLVLDQSDSCYLLLSRYALDAKPYHNKKEAVSKQTSSLEEWVRTTFTQTAFTPEEQAHIVDGDEGHYFFNSDAFLLSKEQALQYFPDDASRICSATAYAQAQGSYMENNVCGWWLSLDGGTTATSAPRVTIHGNIREDESSEGGVERTDFSVRPAIWLKADGLLSGEVPAAETERSRILKMTDAEFQNQYYNPAIGYRDILIGNYYQFLTLDDTDVIYPHGNNAGEYGFIRVNDTRITGLDSLLKTAQTHLSQNYIGQLMQNNIRAPFEDGGSLYVSESCLYGQMDVPEIPTFKITSDSADKISVHVDVYYDIIDPRTGEQDYADEIVMEMICENGRWVFDNIRYLSE